MAVDPAFGVNNFLQPKFYNQSETVANNFLTLLFGKPGFLPSMPEIGVDVNSLLYDFFDEIDVASLKALITKQCYAFMDYVIDNSFDIIKGYYQNQPVLLFKLPIQDKTMTRHFTVGVTVSPLGGITYNFEWSD